MLSPKFHVIVQVLAALVLLPFFAVSQKDIREDMLLEVNDVRAKGCMCGEEYMPPAGPLTWNMKLEKAATRHARDMYANSFFEHEGSDGSTVSKRANAAGYRWSLIGENLAWGTITVEETIEGWVNSPSHCRTLMNPDFKEMGVAKKGTYWVMDLGSSEL